jgi:stage II sporulation protein R
MNKKTIVWAYLIVLSLGTILSLYIPKNEVAAKDAIVIPGQAIRLRILANSDLDSDQALKRKVRDKVNERISVWVKDLTSIKEARKLIESKLPEIQTVAEEVVKENSSDQKVKVKFGKVQFPTKLYGQFLYPAGDYEAVLITLGEGKGANWWCVLFPPLCFLDFSNGVAVSKGFEEKQAKKKTDATPVKISEHEPESDSVQDSEKRQTSFQDKQNQELVSEQPNIEQNGTSQKEDQVPSQEKNEDPTISAQTVQTTQHSTAEIPSAKSIDSNPQSKSADKKQKKEAPVYTAEDDQPIKVKFFAVELWERIF